MPPQPVDISLIISSRNRAYGLTNCLDAVSNAARQANYLRLELVFVDNGSTDNTSDIVREWAKNAPISTNLVYEAKPGLAVARNSGMTAAKGKILAFTDDDCEVFPDYFTVLAALFSADKEPVMRGGRIELGDARDLPVTIKTELEPAVLTSELHTGGFIHGANMAFPRALSTRLDCSIHALAQARRSAPARTPTMCTAPSMPAFGSSICRNLRSSTSMDAANSAT
jgi:GT2 family glycosyltransferase